MADNSTESNAESSLRELRRRQKAASRARLLSKINDLHRHISKPLADFIRDNALHHLPVRSLLTIRSVCNSWSSVISSPFFAHRQSSTFRTISGLFIPSKTPRYTHFIPSSAHSLPDPNLAFLPYYHNSVVSSCNGLLLVLARRLFVVCNPATRQFAELPELPVKYAEETGVVLVYRTGAFNFRPDYLVVVPFRIDKFSSVYGFQVFSSSAGTWWVSNEVVEVESFVPCSGVAAGGVAYWMTTMQSVVGYDPAKDCVRVVTWPMNYEIDVDWRIGCACDDKLYCTAVTARSLFIFKLFERFDGWLPVTVGEVMQFGIEKENQEEKEEKGEGKAFHIVEHLVDNENEKEEEKGKGKALDTVEHREENENEKEKEKGKGKAFDIVEHREENEKGKGKAFDTVEHREKDKEKGKRKAFQIVEFREDGSFIFAARPIPLWFQSGEYEFLFAVLGFVIGLDLAKKKVRWLELEKPGFDGDWERCFSHINTLATVVPLKIVDDNGFIVKEEVE